jgi:hypothetical protein
VTAGTLSTSLDQIIFTYDFNGVVSTYSVRIDDTIAGTFTINGQVYDTATYFATPIYNYVTKILTLTVDLSTIPQNTSGGDFFFTIFIADNIGSCNMNTDDCNKYCVETKGSNYYGICDQSTCHCEKKSS